MKLKWTLKIGRSWKENYLSYGLLRLKFVTSPVVNQVRHNCDNWNSSLFFLLQITHKVYLSLVRRLEGHSSQSISGSIRRKKQQVSDQLFGSQPSAVIACVLNKNVVSWQTRNNRKLLKHKLSQNAKNLQCLLKFGLIEDNVTVFQWSWNSEFG